MSVAVAEYLGQAVEDTRVVVPFNLENPKGNLCPFSGLACRKLHAAVPEHPVCSIRVTNTGNSGLFQSICPDRILPLATNDAWFPHLTLLGLVAQELFPEVDVSDVGYRSQVGITLDETNSGSKNKVSLDYVLTINAPYTIGRNKAVLEVQGGGETSNTGDITRHVAAWAAARPRTNARLRQEVPGAGTIQNNAWKRQLEQVTRKAPIAIRFGAGFALAVGEILFDYIRHLFPDEGSYDPNWEIALVCLAERPGSVPGSGAIPIDTVRETLFLSYADFVAAVTSHPMPRTLKNPFEGTFTTVGNEEFTIGAPAPVVGDNENVQQNASFGADDGDVLQDLEAEAPSGLLGLGLE